MRTQSGTGLSVGGSSILVIFVLLCLTTFATLSMVSANADYKLTQKAAVASKAYYTADAQAEEVFAAIDASLRNLPAGSPPEQYIPTQLDSLSAYSAAYSPLSPTSGLVRYMIPMNDTQAISVVLTLHYPAGAPATSTVAEWKVIVTAPLELDDSQGMTLFSGSIPA